MCASLNNRSPDAAARRFDAFRTRCALLLEEAKDLLHQAVTTGAASGDPLDACVLEERVMLSATPAPLLTSASLPSEPDPLWLPASDAAAAPVLPAPQADDDLPAAVDVRSQRVELVVIDSRVADLQRWVEDLTSLDWTDADSPQRQFEVLVLDADRDGIDQIGEALARHGGVDAVHLVSHGAAGRVALGATLLSLENIDTYEGRLTSWADALSERADLMFYGCDLAASTDGETLMNTISRWSGADVAASDDATGHAVLGGDWQLEFQLGAIESRLVTSGSLQQNWFATLDVLTFQNGVGGYTSTQDTELNSADGDDSYGSENELELDQTPNRHALIQFQNLIGTGPNQIPLGSIIHSASLTITVSGDDSSAAIALYQMLVPWSESDTYDSMNSGIQRDDAEAHSVRDSLLVNPGGTGSKTFTGLAATVQRWAGGDANHGWVIFNDHNDSAFKFYSSEESTVGRRPTLTVDFTAPVAADKVYWADPSSGKIQRSNPDGTAVEDVVTGIAGVKDVVVDAATQKLYWSRTASGVIQSANLDGSNVQTLLSGLTSPQGVAVDSAGQKVYWTEDALASGRVRRADLDGSNVETLVNSGLGSMDDVILDVDAGKVYWIDSGLGNIQRADLHGASVETIVSGLVSPHGLQQDASAGHLYWTGRNPLGLTDAIYRANLDGTDEQTIIGSGVDGLSGLALDLAARKIYWTESSQNSIGVANLDGSNPQDLLTGLTSITAVTLGPAPGANRSPTDIVSPTTATVAENVSSINFGNVTVVDPDAGDTHVWSFSDSRFSRNGGGKLLLNTVSPLDFETEATINVIVTVTDQAGSSYSEMFVVAVTDVNEAPTDVAVDNLGVLENAAGAVVGNLAVTDPDAGDTHAWSVSDNRFEVVAGQLKLKSGRSLDYETEPTVTLAVTAVDQAGTGFSYSESFTVGVTNVNEAPTDVMIDNAAVLENAAGAVIGNLAVTDPDAGDTHAWSVSDNRFEVVAGQLKLKSGQSLDYETEPTVTLTVTAVDQAGTGFSYSESFTVGVTNVNEAPTDVMIDNAAVLENAAGAVIGNLSVTDPDAGDTHAWSVSDNRFQVVAGQLKLKSGQSLDYESEPTVTLTVTAVDQAGSGLSYSESFTIGVTNVNDVPTDIAINNLAVLENAAGAVVGNLTVTDPDTGDTHAWSVSDNRFEIVAGQLRLKSGQSLDHESEPTVSLTVTAVDQAGAGLSYGESFTLGVTNVNEIPTDIAIDNLGIVENAAGAAVGKLTVADPDAGDTHGWSVSDNRFQVVAGQLKLKSGQSINYESEPTVSLMVTAVDQAGVGLSYSESVTVGVTNVNEVPTGITIDNPAILENAAGAVVGNLTVNDPDTGDTHTWSVSDGRFEIVAGQLKLKLGQNLDFETEPSTSLAIEVTDAAGGRITETIAITIIDVDEAPVVAAVDPALAPDGVVTYEIDEDAYASYSLAGLFTDPEGRALRYAVRAQDGDVIDARVRGSVLRIKPAADWHGISRLTVSARDAGGAEAEREIVVQVRPVNDAPVAVADRMSVGSDRSVQIDPVTLLSNDYDVDSAQLAIELLQGPRYGRLTASADGTWSYQADANAPVYDRFTYRVFDGSAYSNPVAVTLRLAAPMPAAPTSPAASSPANKPAPEAPTGDDAAPDDAEASGSKATPVATSVRITAGGFVPPTGPDAHPAAQAAPGDGPAAPHATWTAPTMADLRPETGDATQPNRYVLDRAGAADAGDSGGGDSHWSGADAAASARAAVTQMQLWQAIDSMRQDVDSSVTHTTLTIGATVTATTGMTVGYVVWIVRGGLMLSSVMANLPMWRLMDPMAILNQSGDDDGQADESLASMVDQRDAAEDPPSAATDPESTVQS